MDRYDHAIKYLTEVDNFRAAVSHAWNYPKTAPGGSLFRYCDREDGTHREDGKFCGCLTQVHGRIYVAWTDELTEEICRDSRLCDDVDEITPEMLPVFAEWQRRLDRELRNVEPEVIA